MYQEYKNKILLSLKDEINKNNVDFDMIPYLKIINKLDHYTTLFCCQGHPDATPYVMISSDMPTKQVIKYVCAPFKKVYPELDVSIDYNLFDECEKYPRFTFHFSPDWNPQMAYLIYLLENNITEDDYCKDFTIEIRGKECYTFLKGNISINSVLSFFEDSQKESLNDNIVPKHVVDYSLSYNILLFEENKIVIYSERDFEYIDYFIYSLKCEAIESN